MKSLRFRSNSLLGWDYCRCSSQECSERATCARSSPGNPFRQSFACFYDPKKQSCPSHICVEPLDCLDQVVYDWAIETQQEKENV